MKIVSVAKVIKKIGLIGLILIVLLALTYTTIRSSTFLNRTVKALLEQMSEDLNTEISVGKIEIGWWNRVTLHQVMIRDLNKDTLISAKKVYANLSSFSRAEHLIKLKEIEIDQANVHFEKPLGQDTFNFNFFFKYLTPKRAKNKKPVIWTITSDEARLVNSVFRYRNYAFNKPKDRRFDENFMEFANINADMSSFKIIGDSLNFKVNNLSTEEKSGLKINQLTALTSISKHVIGLDELLLNTVNSSLQDGFFMRYNSYADMRDFINKVRLEGRLKNSKVSLSDIAYFYEPLWGNKDIFTVTGNSEGVISNLDVNNLYVNYGNKTKLIGKVDFTGLPDMNSTLIDAKIKNLTTNSTELGKLLKAEKSMQEVSALGTIQFTGNLIGFAHDFVSRGQWKSDLGNASTDIKFSYDNKKSIESASYKGIFSTESFNLKPLIPSASIGVISGSMEVDGSGFSSNSLNAKFNATINSIEVDNKKLEQIVADGSFLKEKFIGSAEIKDNHANLKFNGEIDFASNNPSYIFTGNVNQLNLSYFGLDTGISIISGEINSNLVGNDIDNIIGEFSFNNGQLLKGKKKYAIQNLDLQLTKNLNYRSLQLNSNIANVQLKGDFELSNLPGSINQILHNLSPAYFPYSRSDANDYFDFDIAINEPALLLTYLPKGYTFGTINANGFFNAKEDKLKTKLNSPFIGINGIQFNAVRVELNKEPNEAMFAKINTLSISKEDFLISDKLNVLAEFNNNNIQFSLKSSGDRLKYDAKVSALANLTKDTISLHFNESGIKVHGRNWKINNEGLVQIQNEIIEISNLNIKTKEQSLTLNGAISKSPSSELKVDFNNLYPGKLLYDLNFLEEKELQGEANGWLILSKLYETPLIQSDFKFSQAMWHNDTIGDVAVKAINSGKNRLIVDGTRITSGPFKGLKANGEILLKNKKNNYNLSLFLPNSKLNIVENFLTGIVSNISGFAQSDKIKLTGKFEEPTLSGKIQLVDTRFKLDYLGTSYQIPKAELEFVKNKINLKPLKIFDSEKHTGEITGFISHKYFSKWNFDISLSKLNQMQLLNTTYNDNELFYGLGYASGFGYIKGPLEGIDIYLKAKTEKGTKVTLPLEDGEASTSVPYINFKKEETSQNRKAKAAFSNINSIIVDIEATKDAIAEIVFDSKVGDVMKGSAEGVLKFEVNKSADFFMYGSLKVLQGDYLFTAFNFVNKPFKIEKGGTIFWDGDPYNAKINLTAIYEQKASLSPLVDPSLYGSETEYERAKERLKLPIDVNSKIKLNGLLFTPKIQFDIDFPNLQSAGNASVEVTTIKNKLENDPQELNKQFLSLLVFNRFLPVSFENIGAIAGSTPGQSASEMLSAQLNNWVSDLGIGIVDNISFDLGKDTANQRELVVSAQKTLFNDRLTIKGAYGNRVGSNATNVSVEYNITKDGNLRLRTNYTPFYYSTLYTNTNQQGLGGVRRGTVGVFFRREFETIKRKKK